MKRTVFIVMMLAALSAGAQQRNNVVPSVTGAVEDFKPGITNQPGRQYPMVNSQGAVRTQLRAPQASSVQLDIGGVRYEMVKDENGVWTGTSRPQDVGFHYYQLNVDGVSLPDPGTISFFGAGRWGSGIEIPSADMDFWQVKNVPQGAVEEKYYWSKATESMRRCYVYLPAEYQNNPGKRYPVLYLQHGNAENEVGWSAQGHTAQILDNLIAEGKAVPFIVVMDYGQSQNIHLVPPYAPQQPAQPQQPRQGQPGARAAGPDAFQVVLLTDIIPMVEREYRVVADAQHRALAGLSMGGGQTRRISGILFGLGVGMGVEHRGNNTGSGRHDTDSDRDAYAGLRSCGHIRRHCADSRAYNRLRFTFGSDVFPADSACAACAHIHTDIPIGNKGQIIQISRSAEHLDRIRLHRAFR